MVKLYLRREWFLSLLLLLYVVLSLVDPSLPGRSLRLVDYESLAAIISLLVVSRGIELSGIFSRAALRLINLSKGSEWRLVALLTLTTAVSSAFIMNDTAMFIFVPLVVMISRITGIRMGRAVTLTAIAANAGSALTPIGNPQNIIIWRTYKLSIHTFVLSMLPYIIVWMGILLLFVRLTDSGKHVRVFAVPRIRINRLLLAASVGLLMVDVASIQLGHAFVGLALTLAVLSLIGREAILSIDVALIAIFALIFVDFGEISILVASLSHSLIRGNSLVVLLAGAGLSQATSNVPATVMLLPARPPWIPLTLGVNLGGNGIIIGSLANFIALRISRIGMREFHRYSLPYFLAALVVTLLFFVM
ncbi:SLC13 family permease [Thermococcus sp.]